MSENLAERIARHRQSAKLTQKQAATRVGISERQWQRYEWSETAPSLDMLDKIAALFGVKPGQLL